MSIHFPNANLIKQYKQQDGYIALANDLKPAREFANDKGEQLEKDKKGICLAFHRLPIYTEFGPEALKARVADMRFQINALKSEHAGNMEGG